MRWLVTLHAQAADVERLLSEGIEGLSADPDDPKQILLELHDPARDAPGKDGADAMKPEIDAFAERLNGVGRLRWGRIFEGVSVSAIKSVDANDQTLTHVFLEPAYDHILPEDYADMVERLGQPRPTLPNGVEMVNGLDVAAAIELASAHPGVIRAVHLIDLMLAGDEEIDWAAGYAALEIVEHDLHDRGLDGHELGWWAKRKRGDFRATANSPEAIGYSARHGALRSAVKERRMTAKEAQWFVQGIVAAWITHLLSPGDADQTQNATSARRGSARA